MPDDIPSVSNTQNIEENSGQIASINFYKGDQVRMMMLKYRTISEVLSMMGGYGSAGFYVGLFIVTVVFYKSFLKSVSKLIKKTHQDRNNSIEAIEEKLISRISYISLYVLHDRITRLETFDNSRRLDNSESDSEVS